MFIFDAVVQILVTAAILSRTSSELTFETGSWFDSESLEFVFSDALFDVPIWLLLFESEDNYGS